MDKQYRPWYERHPERFEEEQTQMRARGFVLNEEAFHKRKVIEFSGQSKVDSSRPLIVRYSDAFPSFPPRVFSDTPGRILERAHQPDSKEICLFGPGQPRWSAELSGTAAIDEAEAIIRQFGNGSKSVDVDVPEPSTAVYHYDAKISVLVPAGIATQVRPDSQGIVGDFHLCLSRSEIEQGVILDIRWSGNQIKAEQLYHSWFPQGHHIRGKLVSLTAPPPYLTTFREYQEWLARIGVRRDRWMAFVFPEESGISTSTRTAWLIIKSSTDSPLRLVKTYPIIPTERLARVPKAAPLATKKVVFIGCGNLGSKIAVPLAATGVSRFGLVDPETYEPDNSLRHEVSMEKFGIHKAIALYCRLLGFNPQVTGQTEVRFILVGGPNPIEQEEQLVEMIASADLVIETTGSHGVSRFINELSYELEVPSMYASVTNGAWGGEIVRVIPSETACWMCWFNQYEFLRPPSEPAPEIGIFAPGCNQPTFTGTSYETGIVANMAAWMAAETLLRAEAGHTDFNGDYLRWEARGPSGTLHPTVKILPVERRPLCPVCNSQ